MTFAAVALFIGKISAIATAVFGLFKGVIWLFTKSAEQQKEDIDKKLQDEEAKVKHSGRPQ